MKEEKERVKEKKDDKWEGRVGRRAAGEGGKKGEGMVGKGRYNV